MSRYNYFDDDPYEFAPKKSAKKLSLSDLAFRAEELGKRIHGDAEEEIRELDELPNLRHAIKKAVIIFAVLLLIIIFIVGFSISINHRVTKTEKFNKDAGNVCINYIKEYGSIKSEDLDAATYGENKAKLTGLCYARQMDFNGDGDDELMLCYDSKNIYYLEVWGYDGGEFKKLYKEEANSTQDETDGYWVAFYHKGDKYYICKTEKKDSKNVRLYSMHSGKFRQHGKCEYDLQNDVYYVNGKESSDDFETIQLSCFRKSKADIIIELVNNNIDAFGNISSQALVSEKSSAELKNSAYYEVVRKKIEKYGAPEVKSDSSGKYIDGVAMVKLVDFNGDGNDELLIVYRSYKSKSKYDNYSGEYIYYDVPRYSLDIYCWDGSSAKRVLNKECVSEYFDDENVFYLLLKNGKKSVTLCTNNYTKENNYSYTANSRMYKLSKGRFKATYSAKLVNDYGYKTYYIDDESVYNSAWQRGGYKVPFFLNDDDTLPQNEGYEMTYFSVKKDSTFNTTVQNTTQTIVSLNADYNPDDIAQSEE